jgi:hypothetical protein
LKPSRKNTFGRPRVFSDAVISALFIIKIFFKLPYRALQGLGKFIQPLLKFLKHNSDYVSICTRAKNLELPKLSKKRP